MGIFSKMSDQKRRNKTADQNWRSQTKAQLQIGKEACTGRPVRSAITSIQDKTTHKNWQSQTMLPLQIGKGACTGRPAAKARGGGVMDKLPALLPVIRL